MQIHLALLALVSAKPLNQLCQEAKANGLDHISIELPLGIDCKDGKCLLDDDADCKVYLKYTHPDGTDIPAGFAKQYLEGSAPKRPFDGLHLVATKVNQHAVNAYNTAAGNKANLLTAPYDNYITQIPFYKKKAAEGYQKVFIYVSQADIPTLTSAIEIVSGVELVAENKATAEAVQAVYPEKEVYIDTNELWSESIFSSTLAICPQ